MEPFVESLVNRYNLDPNKQCNILISLTEAVTNAIVHGNCEQEAKTVQVRSRKERNCIAVRVSDEGNGFEWNSHLSHSQDPCRSEDVNGRGIFLAQSFFPNLTYNDRGNEVTIMVPLD